MNQIAFQHNTVPTEYFPFNYEKVHLAFKNSEDIGIFIYIVKYSCLSEQPTSLG